LTASSSAQPGTYQFTVSGSGGGLTQTATVTLGVVATAPPDQSQGLITSYVTIRVDKETYSLGEAIAISGSVTDYNGNGIPSASVSLTSNFNFTKSVTTDSGGKFAASTTAPANPGAYSIMAKYSGTGKYGSSEATARFNVGSGGNGGTSGSCTILRIAGPTILGQQSPDIFKGIVLPDWFCAKTFGISNWIIVAAIALLIVLWLLFGRRGSGGGGSTQNIYTGG
jgi:hypothetical protein